MPKQLDPLPIVVSTYTLPPIDIRPRHIQDFALVTGYYGCSDEEINEMREMANADPAMARVSYAAIAAEIRFWLRREEI